MSEATAAREATSSIEVTRDAKGSYGWKVKVYFDGSELNGYVDPLVRIQRIDANLRETYLSTGKNHDDD